MFQINTTTNTNNIVNDEGLPIIQPIQPTFEKIAPDGAVAICGKCGLRIGKVMGYVCGAQDCPVFLKATC